MSIGSIGGNSNWWPWQNQATQGTSSTGTTSTSSATSGSITNTGTTASSSNVATFMQAFSADLQSMLTQMGNIATTGASSGTTSPTSTTASTTSPTDSTQNPDAVHHHHHHGAGEGGSMDGTAHQLVGEIGQSLQGGTLTTGQINQSANIFATDVAQALQSYGATTPTTTVPSDVSTVA